MADIMPVPEMPRSPFDRLCNKWQSVIKIASEAKQTQFQDQANEAFRFFNGPHDWMYEGEYGRKSRAFSVGDDESNVAPPTFRMTANKVSELVELFGPILYHRNPHRRVRPRNLPQPPPEVYGLPPGGAPPPPPPTLQLPPDQVQQLMQLQMLQQQYQGVIQRRKTQDTINEYRAALMEFYLNYTPNELKLKDEMRMAIDEAIIKGRGLLWCELYQQPGSDFHMVGSFYESPDNLQIDPDAEKLDDAKWIARRCYHPTWQVEDEYGLPRGTIKGNRESMQQTAMVNSDPDAMYKRKQGETNDMLFYYKVWSRMGVGGRLKGSGEEANQALLEELGTYCYFVVAPDIAYPLNAPPTVLEDFAQLSDPQVKQEVLNRVAWPIPFWLDPKDPWPFTEIDFHPVPRQVWPMSHLSPALGYQKFLNWAYSYLAQKVRTTCRDFIGIDKGASEDAKTTIEKGEDLTIIEITKQQNQSLDEFVKFIQHPPMNQDILKVVDKLEEQFDKATGLNDLMYGATPQALRSAQEAKEKGDLTRIRPDDMANRVEEAATQAARKEAIAVRYMLDPQKDITPVMGQDGAMLWAQLITSTDIPYIMRELDYRVEEGDAKKPNIDLDIENTNQGAQFLWPAMMGRYQATGDPTQVNAFLRDWCKARNFDFTHYEFPPAPPPPPPMPPGAGAGGPPSGPMPPHASNGHVPPMPHHPPPHQMAGA
jgi:hypothetical protein